MKEEEENSPSSAPFNNRRTKRFKQAPYTISGMAFQQRSIRFVQFLPLFLFFFFYLIWPTDRRLLLKVE